MERGSNFLVAWPLVGVLGAGGAGRLHVGPATSSGDAEGAFRGLGGEAGTSLLHLQEKGGAQRLLSGAESNFLIYSLWFCLVSRLIHCCNYIYFLRLNINISTLLVYRLHNKGQVLK